MPSNHFIVFITSPDRATADEIADTLVGDGHAACVNIIPGLTSIYRWQGEVHRDEEWLLIAKTAQSAYRRLEETVLRLHPDDVPEIVAAPLEQGLSDYLHWVTLQTQRD